MSPMWSLGLLCFLAGASYAAEVCFDLGCFNDLPPWGGTTQRPISILPWNPELMGTRYLLFTQKNRYYQDITTDNIHASNYLGMRKTRFIIPGYLKKGEEDWPQEMCKAIVKKENVNCIAVEWKKGVQTQFAQAANNARVVAAQVESMIKFLMERYKQKADKFHIIGHCLGAHAAGEVGSKISGIARITGLDPTEPYFQDTPASVRLDTSDATFVDVIHTDGHPFKSKLGLGMSQSVGHIDFYPNGGELMPGCSRNMGRPADLDAFWQGTKRFDACNHVRAYQYYTESVAKSEGFLAFSCPDQDSFAAGKCFPCVDSECPLMGHNADKFTMTDGVSKTKYFLNTGRSEPFGRYSYRMTLTLDNSGRPNRGNIYVSLTGGDESTEEYKIHSGTLTPGSEHQVIIDAEVDVGEVTEVKFRWNNNILNPARPQFGASKVELQRGKDKKIFLFCGTETVGEDDIQTVRPCLV